MTHEKEGRLKVFFLGTYIPRACGIATFTYDLRNAFINSSNPAHQAYVIAMNNVPNGYKYPPEVIFEINQNSLQDYHRAAEYVNFSQVDLVCVQHEFGIYGGEAGNYLGHFLSRVEKPIVTTLHTVLAQPEDGYYRSLRQVINFSDYLVVMAEKARKLLVEIYDAPEEKIRLIPHGIPESPDKNSEELKQELGLQGKKVLLTFGLLSPNKGIEIVIDALAEIKQHFPDVVYLVVGATHPEVKRHQGEEYREFLIKKSRENGVAENVIFVNKFVSLDELRKYIGACDIYISPYWVREQIVSGTLSYTVGMGKPVISTPSWYAEEVLAEGRGILVDFGDWQALAQNVIKLLNDEKLRKSISEKAKEFGRQMLWSEVGKAYKSLFQEAIEKGRKFRQIRYFPSRIYPELSVDSFRLEHFLNLTDDTGIIQHSFYHIPDRKTGYSTDDVGRALAVMMKYWNSSNNSQAIQLAEKYLSFLKFSQKEDGLFHNFMSYHREFLDKVGSDDTQGRALLGLGMTVWIAPEPGLRAVAKDCFDRCFEVFETNYPMALSYGICSAWAYLKRYPGARRVKNKAEEFAERLYELYQTHSERNWRWVGDIITYGAGKVCTAFLQAGEIFSEQKYLDAGIDILEFLLKHLDQREYINVVGNQGWFPRNSSPALYDQQPICAGYLVEALVEAYRKTANDRYRGLARKAFEWFLGRNRLGIPLYDPNTGGCRDGLLKDGVNLNQGAESLICFWDAYLNLNQLALRQGLLDYAQQAQNKQLAGEQIVKQELEGEELQLKPTKERESRGKSEAYH